MPRTRVGQVRGVRMPADSWEKLLILAERAGHLSAAAMMRKLVNDAWVRLPKGEREEL